MHTERHPLAGKKIVIKSVDPKYDGKIYRLEEWWDKLTGGSWMNANGNPAAMFYAIHCGDHQLPLDDEVVYGQLQGNGGMLIHISELGAVIEEEETED